jgi:hypothetical protein
LGSGGHAFGRGNLGCAQSGRSHRPREKGAAWQIAATGARGGW